MTVQMRQTASLLSRNREIITKKVKYRMDSGHGSLNTDSKNYSEAYIQVANVQRCTCCGLQRSNLEKK